MTSIENRVRAVVAESSGIPGAAGAVGDDDDLFALGMTSHASVNVMLALENEFDVEFPERMLSRRVFQSVGSLADALRELTQVGEMSSGT
jgi:acyl carrier protein